MKKQKEKVKDVKPKAKKLNSECDSTVKGDPHYGEAGHYDENCNWIPSV